MQATVAAPSPVSVEGHFDNPSRALWLVKWLLAIPHFIVLLFRFIAFFVLTIVAFFALLFTGRYPRIFDFNLGVLRWAWRVGFYTYNVNGTDRYPPFTRLMCRTIPLASTSRTRVAAQGAAADRLVVVASQYVIAGIFAGGGVSFAASHNGWSEGGSFGLTGLLVFVASLVLLFRGDYPCSIFDFVLGLNRWAWRVWAYAALLTPEYPPFRLDAGENEPVSASSAPAPLRDLARTARFGTHATSTPPPRQRLRQALTRSA